MRKTLLPYSQVPQLAKTDLAYATADPRLRPFYRHEPYLSSFAAIIRQRQQVATPRATLAEVLLDQYRSLPADILVQENIEALRAANTFTVTTAHQPSLFLGPLYFVYKALTAINLAEAVQREVGAAQRIVPVFVLGSEDHDLEELNHIQLFGKTITWQPGVGGAVGSMPADTLQPALDELRLALGDSEPARALYARIALVCERGRTFGAATQALLHDFFGHYGLVVLDMNDARLKRHFLPVMRTELLEQPSFKMVNQTIERLHDLGFKTQAAPREINLFYMMPGSRERIVKEGADYKVLNTDLQFSTQEIETELENHPERFSPNVVLRPLYQETILPNLAYVGGGGELAYWLERLDLFEHFGLPFPLLMRRHSVLWLDREAGKKLAKLDLAPTRLFENTDALVRAFVEAHAAGEIDLTLEIDHLKSLYTGLAEKAKAIDPTLEKAVLADEVKAVGNLEQWQSRLVRAEKQKHEVALNQIRSLREKLFPSGGLQERTDNFIPYYLKYGEQFFEDLKENLQAFEPGFVLLEADN